MNKFFLTVLLSALIGTGLSAQEAAAKAKATSTPPPPPIAPVAVTIPAPLGQTTPAGWFDDYNVAAATARKTGRAMLVLFTGSDWCGWCVRLRKDVLDTKEFRDFAEKYLILVYVDFPNRTQLPTQLQQANRQLQRLLRAPGGVPCSILLGPDRTRLDVISGYSKSYLDRIKQTLTKHSLIR